MNDNYYLDAVTTRTLAAVNTVSLKVNQSVRNLATGLRINSGADGPAQLISSESLRATLAFLEHEVSSLQRTDQVANSADAALGEVSDLLGEANALEVQLANSGALSSSEQAAIQSEIDSILQEVDRIGGTTTFNGQNLLDGTATLRAARDTQDIDAVSTRAVGAVEINGNDYVLADVGSAGRLADDHAAAQQVIDAAITDIANARARIGGFQSNTVASRISAFSTAIENITAAEAVVRGADFALETAALARSSALRSASLLALADANESQSLVLDLLS